MSCLVIVQTLLVIYFLLGASLGQGRNVHKPDREQADDSQPLAHRYLHGP